LLALYNLKKFTSFLSNLSSFKYLLLERKNKMNELVEKLNVEDMIYEIRGKQVMLDSDLAKLYQCANGTKAINLAVKRNLEKFPDDFYFQITEDEFNNLMFQNETSSINTHGGIRKMPHVFIKEVITMLSKIFFWFQIGTKKY
jgi:hypothetical protein